MYTQYNTRNKMIRIRKIPCFINFKDASFMSVFPDKNSHLLDHVREILSNCYIGPLHVFSIICREEHKRLILRIFPCEKRESFFKKLCCTSFLFHQITPFFFLINCILFLLYKIFIYQTFSYVQL